MIWLVAILLLLVFAGIGYLKGAIRMAVSLLGLFAGLLAAQPLAPFMQPIYTSLFGMTNLLWLAILGPVTAFFLVGLIFLGISFFVHYKVGQYYKFSADEVTRLTWERMNKRTGAALGLMVGGIYTILLGMLVYTGGYFSTQVATDNDGPYIGSLNTLASGLDSSGMGRIARSISPAPAIYYRVSDILGMSHKTPLLEVRYRNYPSFLNMAEDATISAMADDETYHGLLVQQASLEEILKNPMSTRIMSDQALTSRLLETDLDDLRTYLETGESPRFADELLLGRWELDGNATINYFKKNTINVKARDIKNIKMVVGTWLVGTSMIVYPDSTFMVSSPVQVEEPEPEAEEPGHYNDPYGGAGPGAGMDADMQARYGLAPAQGARRAQAKPAKPKSPIQFDGPGTWERKARGRYDFRMGGKRISGTIVVRKNHRAYFDAMGLTLVFKRVW
jgi:hypothetical protein